MKTVGEILSKWLQQCSKGMVDMEAVPRDDSGLDELMRLGAFERVVELAASLGYQDDKTLINRKFKQVRALMSMKRYEEALMSLGVILGCETVALNMVDYLLLHLVRIEIYLQLDDELEATAVIKELQNLPSGSFRGPDAMLRQFCCDKMALKNLVLHNNYKASLAGLLHLLSKYGDSCTIRVIVLVDIIKMLMQMGGLNMCAHYVALLENAVSELRSTAPSSSSSPVQDQFIRSDRLIYHAEMTFAMARFARGDIMTALEMLEKCVAKAKGFFRQDTREFGSPMIPETASGLEDQVIYQSGAYLLSDAVNNIAVVLLHAKRIDDAILRLEQLVQSDPTSFLRHPVIFNLCTLYDLSCTPGVSDNKKRALHMLTKEYNVTAIEWSEFRITSTK